MQETTAVFFDRDGVLIDAPIDKNGKPKSIKKISQLKFNEDIIKTCKILKDRYKLFMVTNQPDFKRKNNTKKNINEINKYIKKKLFLNKVYVCFCDTDSCINRKPNPGMILEAKKKYNIDLTKSFMIGNSIVDYEAAIAANVYPLIINNRNINIKKKFKFSNINKAIHFIKLRIGF